VVKVPKSPGLQASIRIAFIDSYNQLCTARGDSMLPRSLLNCSLAAQKLGRPGASLGHALAAIRMSPGQVQWKALHRAGVACAALHVPQAAAYFMSQVCCTRPRGALAALHLASTAACSERHWDSRDLGSEPSVAEGSS
jgi:hypothetical protein